MKRKVKSELVKESSGQFNDLVPKAFGKYYSLYDNLDQGFCIIRMIFDEAGQPVDYQFLETNRVFEKQTGLKDVIGKKIRDLKPLHEEHWFRIYGNVAKSGKSIRFENEAAHLKDGVFYDVFAFRAGNPEENMVAIFFNDITDKKKSEQALVESEDRFRTILNNSRDVIYCLNLQTNRYEYYSPTARDVVGFPEEYLISMDPRENLALVHPDYIAVLREAHKLCEDTGNADAEYLQIDQEGNYRWLSDHMTVTRDKRRRPLYRYGNVRNITENKRHEDALRESTILANKHLKEVESIYNNVPIGLGVLDINLNYLRINKWLAEINGFSVSEHIGKSVKEVAPSLYEQAKFYVRKIAETGEPLLGIDLVGSTLNQPDLIRSWSEDWMPVKNDEGEVIGISIVVVENTAKKAAEEEVRRAKHALERSQEKLNIALDNGNIGVWEWDMVTGVVTWDERIEKMFGIDTGSFRGTFKAFEELVNEEDLPNITNALNHALEHDLPYETVFRTRDNSNPKYISTKAYINKDDSGRPVSFTGVCMDVTRLKKGTEQLILSLNQELLRSNRELENFAYVASHDLQEPLRMVSSFTQLLQQRYSSVLDDNANEYIRYAVEGSKRMYDVLNGLLAYSRIQTKGQKFSKVDMNKVLEKVKSNLCLKIKETGAVINYKNLPGITADENQMIQLMQNLIENSIKFSKDTPVITVSSSMKDGFYVFSVKDEGIGIEPQYFERVFKIFQRLHTSREYTGTGIGLAICHRIVERHKGKIWVDSKPGSGSAFSFSIPAL